MMDAAGLIARSSYGAVIHGSLEDPQWANSGRVHDWRNYIPTEVRDMWPDLDETARAIAYFMAEKVAADEDWD